jgi:hypothetical protein
LSATDAVRAALERGPELKVTVVPRPTVPAPQSDRVSMVFDR